MGAQLGQLKEGNLIQGLDLLSVCEALGEKYLRQRDQRHKPHYYLTNQNIPETGMEMYSSVEKTKPSINQANRCVWDYKFINEAMNL